jgi:hypothetical protein
MQLMELAEPALISLEAANANHPFGKGGRIFFPFFLNRRDWFIAERLSREPF